MHSCQKGAGAVSAVCLASAQSSHMFSDMWEFELAQGGLCCSMQLISLSLHTNPAVLSMQMRGGGWGLSWVCSLSASLLFHFKWINDKSPPPPFYLAGNCPPLFSPLLHHIPANLLFLVCRHLPLDAPSVTLKTICNNTTDYVRYSHDCLQRSHLKTFNVAGKEGLSWFALSSETKLLTLTGPFTYSFLFLLTCFKLVNFLLPSIIGPVTLYFPVMQWLNRCIMKIFGNETMLGNLHSVESYWSLSAKWRGTKVPLNLNPVIRSAQCVNSIMAFFFFTHTFLNKVWDQQEL